jgi:predicted metal-dependent phosphoesterase TrpH
MRSHAVIGRGWLAVPAALAALIVAAGPGTAGGLMSETSLRFWRMHQPDSPFRDPDWMQQRPAEPAANGRYGTRNLREAYTLLSSPEAEADLEPERLGRKLLLALPLAGRGNGLPLLLEPSGSLAAVLAEREIFGMGRREQRIHPPPGFVALDTHVHTCFSPDSVADPAIMLLAAARRGLAGIAVTDHNTLEGAHRAEHLARQLKAQGKLPAEFCVIPGEEIGAREGHIIGLFLQTPIPADRSAEETIAAIHAQGGLAVAAHPLLPSGVGRLAATLPFDAVETVNMAEMLHFAIASSRANRRRAPFYAGLTGPFLGVSDAHDPSIIGMGYTLIPGAVVDEAGLRRALIERSTRAETLTTSQRPQRLASRIAGPAASGFATLRSVTGWGGRLLKSLTGADQARLSPRFGHGGLGWSMSLSKRF